MKLPLTKQGVEGFTEVAGAHGVGTSGVRMGSAVHPKTSVILMTVVETETRVKITRLSKTTAASAIVMFRAYIGQLKSPY